MSNPVYSALAGGQQPPMANLQNAIAQIKADPAAMLRQRGLNIPAGMNNPQQIINHLMQSGQLPQGRLAQIRQMAAQYIR